MEIRKDFEPVGIFMNRLLKLAEAFSENNNKYWSHLKNNEDFDKIYLLSDDIRLPIEEIYSQGRDCAIFMSDKLSSFNNSNEYPTLSSYVDSFEDGWVYQYKELKTIYDDAASAAKTLSSCPWSVNEMLKLFLKQTGLLFAIKETLNFIKNSYLYRMEKGEVPVIQNSGVNSGVNIGSIHGKVNINSTDNSIAVSIGKIEVFSQLRDTIAKSEIQQPVMDEILLKLNNMESAYCKSDFAQKYNDFIQAAANHMTIIAPFIPALTKLIGLTGG